MKMNAVAALICAVTVLGGGSVGAVTELSSPPQQEKPAAKVERKGVMAGLPSAPGPHLEKIKKLGDNEWINLGSPAPDPKWGKPTGRTWGAKMPYAHELLGGFMIGEGPHAFVKPNGYQDDDLWFYDSNAHRWICVWPGTNTRTLGKQIKDKEYVFDEVSGQIVDKTGQPIPIHTLIHAWGTPTYNADDHKFVWATKWNAGSYFNAAPAEAVKMAQNLGSNAAPNGPWFYDTVSGRFERSRVTGEAPGYDNNTTYQFNYLPALKQYHLVGQAGSALFDPVKRSWTAIPGSTPGVDYGACYDSKRHRLYVGGGNYVPEGTKAVDNFFQFDCASKTWSKPMPKGDFPLCMCSNTAFFNYDAVNDVVVVMIEFGKQIYVYDPKTNSWSGPTKSPDGVCANNACNCFYSPEHNAYFIHTAHDGVDNGIIWAYRYKNHKATKTSR